MIQEVSFHCVIFFHWSSTGFQGLTAARGCEIETKVKTNETEENT